MPPAWARVLGALPSRAAKAGLLYIQIGRPWPPWIRFVVRAAAANRAAVDFYFLGPSLELGMCSNCVRLQLDEGSLLERVERHLGLTRGSVTLDDNGRKLCDMKPMWAALFPELRARHEWIGYSDHDILLGDLAAEVQALLPQDELLTPAAWFPQPLTNGNLLLIRTTPKMVYAFKRSPAWRTALRQRSIYVFDEHWGSSGPGMHHVYHSMLMSGELRARPTQRFLVQDMVFMRGKRHRGLYPTIASFGAVAKLTWNNGALVAARDGPCVCSAQVWDIDLGGCAECLTQPDRLHQAIRVRRHAYILGFHFQVFKNHWRQRSRLPASLSDFVPHCAANVSRFQIDLPTGFQCSR